MGALSLCDSQGGTSKGIQVITFHEEPAACRLQATDGKLEAVVDPRDDKERAARSQFRPVDSVCPRTPARKPDIVAEMKKFETIMRSARQTPGSPFKSSSPTKVSFLTKDSNTKSFTGWDVDERLHGIESQFKVMKEAMNVSLTDRKTLEDAVDLAKTRGILS